MNRSARTLGLLAARCSQVMEKGFIHQGKKRGKRVRQSRIYYIRGLDHKFYRVTGSRS